LLNGSVGVANGNIGAVNLESTEVLKAGALKVNVLRVDVLRAANMAAIFIMVGGGTLVLGHVGSGHL